MKPSIDKYRKLHLGKNDFSYLVSLLDFTQKYNHLVKMEQWNKMSIVQSKPKNIKRKNTITLNKLIVCVLLKQVYKFKNYLRNTGEISEFSEHHRIDRYILEQFHLSLKYKGLPAFYWGVG